MDICANMHDLMTPFSKKNCYYEAMQGSYLIKQVLSALYPNDPEWDYHNLDDVRNGGDVSNTFAAMRRLVPEKREKLWQRCGVQV